MALSFSFKFVGNMYRNPRVVGNGKRTVVLSHGYGTNQALWDKVLPHLSRTNKVLYLTHPSYLYMAGSLSSTCFLLKVFAQVLLFDWDFSSGPVAGEEQGAAAEQSCYTFSRFADELVALMDEMKLSDAVYVGHSMAGMVGCIASIKRPDLFAHLVLVGASPR
jgi:pimeloyl-ACP methyl ester carboxylesterase